MAQVREKDLSPRNRPTVTNTHNQQLSMYLLCTNTHNRDSLWIYYEHPV